MDSFADIANLNLFGLCNQKNNREQWKIRGSQAESISRQAEMTHANLYDGSSVLH